MFPKFLTTQSLPIVAIIGQVVTTELIIFALELRDYGFAVTDGTHPCIEIAEDIGIGARGKGDECAAASAANVGIAVHPDFLTDRTLAPSRYIASC
jgi:hypothetical protein